jgi:hypothetical protein
MPDTLTIASVTSPITLLASEVGKGIAGDAAKDAWKKIKELCGWQDEPAVAELPERTVNALEAQPELAEQVREILASGYVGAAGQLVGSISADKVIVRSPLPSPPRPRGASTSFGDLASFPEPRCGSPQAAGGPRS